MTPPITIIPHPHDATEACPGGCEDIKVMEDAVCKYRREISEIDARISETHDQLVRFEARLAEGSERMSRMEITISSNAGTLVKNTAETSEILGILRQGESLFKFARHAGDAIRWVLVLAAAAVAFWITIKGLIK